MIHSPASRSISDQVAADFAGAGRRQHKELRRAGSHALHPLEVREPARHVAKRDGRPMIYLGDLVRLG
jgi:hypothetical protein